jgi:hypothetical protein
MDFDYVEGANGNRKHGWGRGVGVYVELLHEERSRHLHKALLTCLHSKMPRSTTDTVPGILTGCSSLLSDTL